MSQICCARDGNARSARHIIEGSRIVADEADYVPSTFVI